jgi:hypothetical protein
MLRNKKNRGFTVAEVIVAAAIFMVFSAALFSIYRMGSRMYVSGSWKFIRQKDAERFFEVLKERVEQTSNVVTIQPAVSDNQIRTDPTRFRTKTGTIISLAAGARAGNAQQLAEFAVCKPCQILTTKKLGIIVLHSLAIVPNTTTGLYDLNLYVRRIDGNEHNQFFGFDSAAALNMSLNDFRGNPSNFGLQPVPSTYTLRDVCGVTIGISRGEQEADARDTLQAVTPTLFDIKVKMRNPKHPQTVLEMGYKSKIDGSVVVEEVR